jgi:hypothetical protein
MLRSPSFEIPKSPERKLKIGVFPADMCSTLKITAGDIVIFEYDRIILHLQSPVVHGS